VKTLFSEIKAIFENGPVFIEPEHKFNFIKMKSGEVSLGIANAKFRAIVSLVIKFEESIDDCKTCLIDYIRDNDVEGCKRMARQIACLNQKIDAVWHFALATLYEENNFAEYPLDIRSGWNIVEDEDARESPSDEIMKLKLSGVKIICVTTKDKSPLSGGLPADPSLN
jgi:hypothetical protein